MMRANCFFGRAMFLSALATFFVPSCHKGEIGTANEKHAEKKKADVILTDAALAAANLSTAKVKREEKKQVLSAVGSLNFAQSQVAHVGSSVVGRVAQIVVVPGQTIKKGGLLVVVDSAEASLTRADLLSAQSRYNHAEREYEREKKLMAGGVSNERLVHEMLGSLEIAKYDLKAAEDKTKILGSPQDGSAKVRLTSPISGTVLEIKARSGQPVNTNDTIVTVGEISTLWLNVDIYERDVSRVHLGDEVRIETLAYPGEEFLGVVSAVGTMIDSERRVLEARIILKNDGDKLKPGMTATAKILSSISTSLMVDGEKKMVSAYALVVPKPALQFFDGSPHVFVEKIPGQYDLRPIEKGTTLEGGIEITRGLNEGEIVVTDGSFILKSEVLKSQMGSND